MILLYLLRRDLRLSDNVVFSAIADSSRYSKLVPLYIIPPHQIQASGFLSSPSDEYPYPEARSRLGKFWRTGFHRVRFIAQGLWDLKMKLKDRYNSDLVIRVGPAADVVTEWLESEEIGDEIGGVWMTRDWASEEMHEESDIEVAVKEVRKRQGRDIEWKVWNGEEMFIHDEDLPHAINDTPDVFTTFRESLEPLKRNVRRPLPTPKSLPPLPSQVPSQSRPLEIPSKFNNFIERMEAPVKDLGLPEEIKFPANAISAHPFEGGETAAHNRLRHLLSSGAISSYKRTRNEMLGEGFSTKLSAYLANGFISARQVNAYLDAFEAGQPFSGNEDGELIEYEEDSGFGEGENEGTSAVRFELLWRDYMRLCMRKFGDSLFNVHGFRGWQQKYAGAPRYKSNWLTLSDPDVEARFTRFQLGQTGTSLIDASMRELYLTGYTSNRARQNVASYLAKWLGIDWRLGAEWYECCLVDYDVASNWGNWGYVAGVGNDPRGRAKESKKRSKNVEKRKENRIIGTNEGRKFNPVKQGIDYDPQGAYVKTWMEELSGINDINVLMQPFKAYEGKRIRGNGVGIPGLQARDLSWVLHPLVKIDYAKPKARN